MSLYLYAINISFSRRSHVVIGGKNDTSALSDVWVSFVDHTGGIWTKATSRNSTTIANFGHKSAYPQAVLRLVGERRADSIYKSLQFQTH